MLPLGTTLHNRYEVEQLLDHSAFGDFYLARDRLAGGIVALKINTLPGIELQFAQAVDALAGIQHQALPLVIEYFSSNGGRVYSCMHDLAKTLEEHRQLWPRQQLSPQAAILALLPVLDALQQIHQLYPPLAHGDIRPANIYLTSRGQVSLTNFGLAGLGLTARDGSSYGMVTPGFSPLEQERGSIQPQIDLYAVGATLYTLVLGLVPPPATERAQADMLVAPRQIRPDLTVQLEEVILALLEMDLAKRFTSAEQAADALSEALGPQVCTHCHRENRPTAKFCRGCGDLLPMANPGTALAQALVVPTNQGITQPFAAAATVPIVAPVAKARPAATQPFPQHATPTPPQGNAAVGGAVVGAAGAKGAQPQQRGSLLDDARRSPLILAALGGLVILLLACIAVGTMLVREFSPATTYTLAQLPSVSASEPDGTAAAETTVRMQETRSAEIVLAVTAQVRAITATALVLGQTSTAQAQAQEATQVALAALAATQTALVPTITPTPLPTETPTLIPTFTPIPPSPTPVPVRLRFVVANYNDDPSCISVGIRGVNTSGWRFSVNGLNIGGNFDGGGNARACGLGPSQEVTINVYNRGGQPVLGGQGVPARGSAIMVAEWR